MATIQWKYQYRTRLPGGYTYYGGGSPVGAQEQVLEAFVIDHLNRCRKTLVTGLRQIEVKAKLNVQKRSRVDTGNMRNRVYSEGSYNTDILRIRFGWKEMAPYYAPFQEFGTRTGITPMRAVYAAYNEALSETRRLVK